MQLLLSGISQLDAVAAPSVGYLLSCVLLSIVILFVMIIFFRIQAFLALIATSVLLALMTGLDLLAIGKSVQDGMGGSLGFIATVVGLGAIFGKILEVSGGAETIAKSLIGRFGESKATWALTITGFLISIPVFLDVGLVLVAPTLFALARDAKKSVLRYAFPLLAGMVVTHACIPPTPGPIAVAEFLNADLGWVIFFGFVVGLPTAIICGPFLGVALSKRVPAEELEVYAFDSARVQPELKQTSQSATALPPFGLILAIMGLPLILMVAGSVVESARKSEVRTAITQNIEANNEIASAEAIADSPLTADESDALFYNGTFWKFVSFLGHPIIALILATFLTWYVLGIGRGFSSQQLMDLSTASLGPAGIIILVTGAGGVFKTVLKDSGAAEALATTLTDLDLPILALAFLIATLIRVIQGSATVAMVTSATLMANIVTGLDQPLSPQMLALMVLAIAFGASACSHLNDSGFWLVSRYLGMSERQTFKTWTVLTTAIALVGFALTMLAGYVVESL
jgi:Gnt-I system low-affinity gluconate transporter